MAKKNGGAGDAEMMVFQGEKPLEPGEVRLHQFGPGNLFGRSVKEVVEECRKASAQVMQMVAGVSAEAAGGFAVDSVEVSLGFSASGKVVFIAEAGVEASITLTFARQKGA